MTCKIVNQKGETLVETLVAMLVIVSAIVMLTGGIVTSARINRSARDLDASFTTKKAEEVSGAKLYVVHNATNDATDSVYVKAYRTNDANQYCYYEEFPINNTP